MQSPKVDGQLSLLSSVTAETLTRAGRSRALHALQMVLNLHAIDGRCEARHQAGGTTHMHCQPEVHHIDRGRKRSTPRKPACVVHVLDVNLPNTAALKMLCCQSCHRPSSNAGGHASLLLTSYLRIWCHARSLTPLWMATTLLMSPGSAGQPLRRMAL